MRLRNVKHAKETIEQNSHIVIPSPHLMKGKWQMNFDNANPIHLEIGCGKGQFIYESAQKHPNINYIGIEKFDSVIIRALEKLMDNPLPNVRLIRVDAEKVTDLFARDEIHTIYLNFSDPWPKRRQAKRRLTSNRFLNRYHVILKDKGIIQMKTDNFNLFQYSIMQFNQDNHYDIQDIKLDLYKQLPKDNIQTEFEQRFVEQGNLIFQLITIHKGETNEKIL